MFPRKISGLKVLFVTAEVAPFSSAGGLSQVSYFLPRALLKMGIDVRIFSPKYGSIREDIYPTKMAVEKLTVPTDEADDSPNPKELICNVKSYAEVKKSEPTVYFLENMEYYEKRANVYGYSDDHIRFGLLSRGALEFIKTGYFVPDLIHCNDWHTAYIPNYLKQNGYIKEDDFKKITTLLSVHNTYQGNFDFAHASEMDFDDGKGPLSSFFSDRFTKQNALKRGIINADLINTVSETYARELLTEEYGAGLNNLFKELRGKLFGVLNGIDYNEFNPMTDKIIKRNFNHQTISQRAENKTDLQKEFNLDVSVHTPILAFSGRLTGQKGIDLIRDTIDFILKEFDVQLVVNGPSDDSYRDFFLELEKKYPQRVGTHLMWNPALPRKIFAGADIQLMPSKYEPGGIVAIESMRYGCIPLVRLTGGLADSVKDFNPKTGQGNGFTFKNYSAMSFLTAVVRALETYKNQTTWKKLVRQSMLGDFSWVKSAEKYLDLFDRAIQFHKEATSQNPPMAFRQN